MIELPTAVNGADVRRGVEQLPALHAELRDRAAERVCARLSEAWRGWTQLDWMTNAIRRGAKREPMGWPGNEIVELLATPTYVGPIAPRPRPGDQLWYEPLGEPPRLHLEPATELDHPPMFEELYGFELDAGPVRGWAFDHPMWADDGRSDMPHWPVLRDPVAAWLWASSHHERVRSSTRRKRSNRNDAQAVWARWRDAVEEPAVGFWNVFAQVVAQDVELFEQQPQSQQTRPAELPLSVRTRDGLMAVRQGIATQPANRRGASWH